MIFYSSFAVLIGILSLFDLKRMWMLSKLGFSLSLLISISLLSTGIISFIIRHDLTFTIIFTVLIAFYVILMSKVKKLDVKNVKKS